MAINCIISLQIVLIEQKLNNKFDRKTMRLVFKCLIIATLLKLCSKFNTKSGKQT